VTAAVEAPVYAAQDRLLNIADRIRRQAQAQPHALAVVEPRQHNADGRRSYAHLTFAQLEARIDTYARGLTALGVTPGMRALLMVKPSLDFFGLTFALFRVGAVPVLLDPAMGKHNVLGAIAEVEPQAFIAIPKGHVARLLYGKAFSAVKINVTVGPKMPFGGSTLTELAGLGQGLSPFRTAATKASDLAAILFTSGSTGAPKGVLYTHSIFDAQVRIFEEDFRIEPGEVDLSAFPLFSLFSAALGAKVVIPDMDATKPAQVDALKIVEAIEDHGVTYAFGSPAFWNRVAAHCEGSAVKMPSLRRVLMAGAPAPPSLLERLAKLVPESADVYTPYGATECLPISLPSARSLLGDATAKTVAGAGTCVGRPIPGSEVRIIRIDDGPMTELKEAAVLGPNEVGEIVVTSPVTTPGYFRRPSDDAKHKLRDGDRIWHRMGDVGYLDDAGQLWFCGRKSHRVETHHGPLYTEQVEPIFNTHPRVYRSALVGRGARGQEQPVLVVECRPEARPGDKRDREGLIAELVAVGQKFPHTAVIREVHFWDALPVDARHNAKIRREDVRAWVEKQKS
jgi:acyl-CoA synthetase (AMP-forming)/AMP-acid ligase II